jgi:pre-rRNA-processing protein RIX1
MSLPLSVILKDLDGTPTNIIEILSSLKRNSQVFSGISKADLNHLVSRVLKLARSPKEYNKWCGTILIQVLSGNYDILASDGVALLSQLFKNLEDYNGTIDVKILLVTVEAINAVCKQIRGKPTLTREILTPRLSTIIGLYIEKLQFHPVVIIKSLLTIMKHHPTTFRPYGNKLASSLMTLINLPGFETFPKILQDTIYQTLATLPVIEKSEPEATWESNVKLLIKQLKSVVLIYQEFLNFNDDGELLGLLNKIPDLNENDSKSLLPDLAIDINNPVSIYQISNRIQILLQSLQSYVIQPTSYTVKVPLGLILCCVETICSVNTRFLSFKYDIRDDLLKEIITTTTAKNHVNAVKLLKQLALVYKGSMVPHLNAVLSTLEVLVPMKNKKIDFQAVVKNETFYCELLGCVEVYLGLVGNLGDSSILLRIIDVSLFLVEPRVESSPTQEPKKATPTGLNKKQKKKKNQSSVPLSDLLSHQHLFIESIPSSTVKLVRKFLNRTITVCNLPLTHHYKIMRYLIIEAVNARHYNQEHIVPSELKTLLINCVLYPGYENISILPIVSQLLPNDPLLSVFNNPKFPPLPIYIRKPTFEQNDSEIEEEEEGEADMEVDGEKLEESESEPKRRKLNFDPVAQQVTDERLFKPTTVEPLTSTSSTSQPTSTDVTTEPGATIDSVTVATEKTSTTPTEPVNTEPEAKITTIETKSTPAALEDKEDSDFEIPELNIDSDDE